MSRLSIPQLAFIVEAFALCWPCVGRPPGAMWGNRHPWDASVFIDRTIHEIASRPTPEATEALQRLINGPAATYVHVARHALAQQRKARRDFEYAAPSVADLQAVMTDDLPETIDDMRAYLADRIEVVQERFHGGNTDMWAVYWVDNRPRPENFCRDRLPGGADLEPTTGLDPARAGSAHARSETGGLRCVQKCDPAAGRDQGPVASRRLGCRFRSARCALCPRVASRGLRCIHRPLVRRRTRKATPPPSRRSRPARDASGAPTNAVQPDSGGPTLAD